MITVFGASGYTGQLVAHELAAAGLPLRLAGRSAARLTALADDLPTRPELLVADATNAASLAALASGSQLLVNCAGPFTDIGEPVAALAARYGLCYIDTANELGYVHTVYTRLDALARASGATLVPACAFEVALADCAVALLARELPIVDAVDVVYRLPGMGSSYGTRASALRSLATSWLAYRGGRFIATRPGAGEYRKERFADGRSYPTLAFPSSETVTVPAHLAVRDVTTRLTSSRLGAILGPWVFPLAASLLRGPMGALLRMLAERAAVPPSAAVRAQMPFMIAVAVRAQARTCCLSLRGYDPYGLTARIVAYTVAQLSEKPPPVGVIPPARVLDPAAFLDAAHAWGVTIEEGPCRSYSGERYLRFRR
jgi:short subunit dehydrogenase-like uncharacterized protein